MSDEITFPARKRQDAGSAAARRLRGNGDLPAVIYSGGEAAVSIQLKTHDFVQLLHHHGESMVMMLEIEDDKPVPVLLKSVQHHPVSGDLLHADFQQVSLTETIEAPLPVELIGEAPGVEAGGILDQALNELEISCLPMDMPESIQVDVSSLNIGDHLSVSDVVVDSKIKVLTDGELTIASVLAPRSEEEEEADTEEDESAEPEVIGEEKAEEEDES